MENKQKILNIVQGSQLSAEDKKEWEIMTASAVEDFLEALAILLETFPAELPWFTEILKKKKTAFSVLKENKEKGEQMLQEIYSEEKLKLQELAKKQA